MKSCQETHSNERVILILCLVSASIIARYFPGWLSCPVKDLIPPESGIRPDWLSRLKGRLLPALSECIEKGLKRGRPVVERMGRARITIEEELRRVRELFEIKLKKQKKSRVQEWAVEVYQRLQKEYGLRIKEFCHNLGISKRTFRSWRRQGARPAKPAPVPEPPAPPRGRGEGRFDLERTLPGIQQMADTTNWNVLGVPLKVMASQDPGDRKRELHSGFRVELAETGEKIIQLAEDVAAPGTQFISDRGSPYMSKETKESLDDMHLDHAPCKEFAATEKATLERSFRTVKECLAPLVEFMGGLSGRFPALRSPALALQAARLLLKLFHHVFSLGHGNFKHPLEGEDLDILKCIAEEQREKARSEQRSKLSTLERIHKQYNMNVSIQKFISANRNFALEDIQEAEQRMQPAAIEKRIISPHGYFARILNNVAKVGRERRRKQRELEEKLAIQRKMERIERARIEHLESNPVAKLHHGLDFLSCQWRDDSFLFDGMISRAFLRGAIEKMAASDPLGFEDEVRLECRRWHAGRSAKDPSLQPVAAFVDRIIADVKPQVYSRMQNRLTSPAMKRK